MNAGSSSLKASVLGGDDALLFDEELPPVRGDGLVTELRLLLNRVPVPDAVAHRIVHGGAHYRQAIRLDADAEAQLAELRDLAPLHNPRAVAVIEAIAELRPELVQFACFDTTFHLTMPTEATTYALPHEWSARWGIRRYGFHGLSHAWATRRVAELLGRPLEELRIVSAHIGSGASLAAVALGKSIDTTMGFTPLEGLVMATRSGTIDPGLVLWLQRDAGLDLIELEEALEHGAGLLGMAGTADLREVISRVDIGDETARLAYGVYVHRMRQEFGAMVASLEGVDAIVFTGGAGAGSARLRSDVCGRLGYLGAGLDELVNSTPVGDAIVSLAGSRVAIAVVRAREDLEIARQVRSLPDTPA